MDLSLSWPWIIITIIGIIVVIYSATAAYLPEDRRIFGALFIALWTILWVLILWKSPNWWLFIVPLVTIVTFFILIPVLNLGVE